MTGDRYSPYNKPASIVHWCATVARRCGAPASRRACRLEHAKPTAEYVVILDADMVIRRPITAELVEVERGRPISAFYGYLKGVFPENYMKVKERVKNVEKAQQVGGFSVMHLEDLKKVAPLWLKWTEEVRQDPESWGNTGDIYNSNGKGGPPWIAEMYGYVFACAEVGLNFKVSDKFMLYPGYSPPAPEPWPVVMHYGLTFYVGEYAFDKHWYMSTDMTSCPSQLFARPPTVEELRAGGYTPALDPGSAEERRVEAALTVGWGLYNATRAHAMRTCGIAAPKDPAETRYRCSTNEANVVLCAKKSPSEFNSPPPRLPSGGGGAGLRGAGGAPLVLLPPGGGAGGGGGKCEDLEASCCGWAAKGECASNAVFMAKKCARACEKCVAPAGAPGGCTDKKPDSAPKVVVAAEDEDKAPEVVTYPPPPTPPAAEEDEEAGHQDPALVKQVVAPVREIKPHLNAMEVVGGEEEIATRPPPKKATPKSRRLGDGGVKSFGGDAEAQPQDTGGAAAMEGRTLPLAATWAAALLLLMLCLRAVGRARKRERRKGGGGAAGRSPAQERKGV